MTPDQSPYDDVPTHGPEGEHEWVARLNDDGDLYEVCLRCGKQAHWQPLLAEPIAEHDDRFTT